MKDSGAVLDSAHRPPFKPDTRASSDLRPIAAWAAWASQPLEVAIVCGHAAVAAMHPMLVELSLRSGQTGAMDSLEFALRTPTALEKTPRLLLVGLRPGVPPADATADDVQGAVLVHEYRVTGRGVGVFATDDVTGRRTVIAPPGVRMRVAESACRALLKRGASIVLLSIDATGGIETPAPAPVVKPIGWVTTRTLTVPRDLPLESTLSATLARLGRHTRRNFRRYRMRLEQDLGATFVPRVEMAREVFLEMNSRSLNAVPEAEAEWRFDSLAEMRQRADGREGPLFAGVRAADGRWLSVVFGSRHDGITEMEWQMNRSELPRYSLSTVMRAYLLEHEIALGTHTLMFKGGTPHPLRHSLQNSQTVDLIVMRSSIAAWLIRRLARFIFPRANYLGNALRDKRLVWTRW
jgi:hypothetical protein